MENLKVFKIRYFTNGGDLAVSVVVAETIEEAIQMLIDDYEVERKNIEEYEEIEEKEIVLTWYQPV
jgi:hypothetical protein